MVAHPADIAPARLTDDGAVPPTPVLRRRGRVPSSGAGWTALAAVGIVVLAFNLRPAAVSVGPVLDEVTAALGVGSAVGGVLTSLPVVAFAVFGATAPGAARRLGPHRVTVLALLAVVVGLAGRVLVDSAVAFLGLSLLSLAGMATSNVLLPSLVRRHFPHRIGALTAAYSTSLAVGLTLGSALTVPLAQALGGDVAGGWRWGLGAWAIAAAVAVLPWLVLARHDRRVAHDPDAPPLPVRVAVHRVARTRLGWAMALFFGLQSLQAYVVFGWFAQLYRDAGFSPQVAGLLLGVITGVSIPLSVLVPVVAARMSDQRPLVVALTVCFLGGYTGLLVAPVGGAWLWAVLVGTGLCMFPLCLTLLGLRTRSAEGTAALSGFTQAVGYGIAVVGPIGIGILHDRTGSWTAPLVVLLALSVPQMFVGLAAARPRMLEDELDAGTAPGDLR